MLQSRCAALVAAVLLAASAPLAAQDHPHYPGGHQFAFGQGAVQGLTIGAPQLDLNGGFFFRSDSPEDRKEGFVRLHAQVALGTPYLALASDLLFLPGVGATPTFSAVAQVQPIRPTSRFYLSAGFGAITGRAGSQDELRALVQGVAAVRLPVHEVTPFVQVSRALREGEKAELLFGIAHPLAPYKFHLP